MFQTPPFYGLVLLWPQLSVYGAPAWGPDEFYITLHAPLKKHCGCGRLQRAVIVKLFFWAARSARSSMRKFWRMCQPTRPATWRRWNPFSNSRRRRKGRGSAFWSRPSSPSTGTSMSPTTRGEQRPAALHIRGFIIHKLLLAQCESCVQRAPPNPDVHQWARGSQMVEEQSRPSHAYWLAQGWGGLHTFSAQTRRNIQTEIIVWSVYFMPICQDWVPPVKKLNRKKRQKRKESRPWVAGRNSFRWVSRFRPLSDVLCQPCLEWWLGGWRCELCTTTLEKKETNCPLKQVTS